jgi:hypothetical protein
MRSFIRLVAVLCAALCTLAALAGPAAARRAIGIETSNRSRTLLKIGRLSFEENLRIVLRVSCRTTFSGEFTRNQVDKAAHDRLPEGRIAQWREVRVAECSGGTLIFLVPVDEVYHAFLGTLPEITGILVIDLIAFEVQSGAVRCLYSGPVGYLYRVESRGQITSGSYLNEAIPLSRGTEGCPGSMTMSGTDTVEPPWQLRLVDE